MKNSNSMNKMNVEVVDTEWQKRWVKVTLKNSSVFYPSFEDLHRIIQAICECEDIKYPKGEGRKMVAAFLWESCFVPHFIELAEKYKIPIRDKEKIIISNGANLERRLHE